MSSLLALHKKFLNRRNIELSDHPTVRSGQIKEDETCYLRSKEVGKTIINILKDAREISKIDMTKWASKLTQKERGFLIALIKDQKSSQFSERDKRRLEALHLEIVEANEVSVGPNDEIKKAIEDRERLIKEARKLEEQEKWLNNKP